MWKQFRKHCDDYFKLKDSFFAGKEDRQKVNLKEKEKIVLALNKWKPSKEKETSIVQLEKLASDWSKIGFVPNGDKEKISREFAAAIDGAYGKLDISKEERMALAFGGRIKNLLDQKNPLEALKAERKKIGEKKGKLKDEKLQMENNLSFFSGAKDDNPLLKDAKSKIQNIESWIAELDGKTKMLNIEVNRLTKAAKELQQEKEQQEQEGE